MVNRNNFYCVQGWMILDLDLKGNELAAYAIIYGYSQDGESKFQGSLKYISEWIGCTKRGTIKILDSLIAKGLIEKEVAGDGKSANSYRVIQNVKNGSEQSSHGVVNCETAGSELSSPEVVNSEAKGSELSSPNNNIYIYNNYNNIDSNHTPGGKKQEEKHKYGEYKNVLLTDRELEEIQMRYDDWKERIERLSEYIASTGKKYRSHYATIRMWAKRDREKMKNQAMQEKKKAGSFLDDMKDLCSEWGGAENDGTGSGRDSGGFQPELAGGGLVPGKR